MIRVTRVARVTRNHATTHRNNKMQNRWHLWTNYDDVTKAKRKPEKNRTKKKR